MKGLACAVGLLLGSCSLALLTIVAISSRAENNAAVLRQINIAKGEVSLKLSYQGPLYAGDGRWESKDGQFLGRSKWGEPQGVKRQQLRSVGEAAGRKAAGRKAEGQKAAAFDAARAAGLRIGDKGPQAIGGSQWLDTVPASREVRAGVRIMGKLLDKPFRQLRKAVEPVGAMLGRAVSKGSNWGTDVSAGFSQVFDIQDSKVSPKRPVKMLTHV